MGIVDCGLSIVDWKTRTINNRQSNIVNSIGFTLVELLIAATMMSILMIGLGSHLRGGLLVWRRTTESAEFLQRQRVALDRMARDLANAVAYQDVREDVPLPPASIATDSFQWVAAHQALAGVDSVRWVTYSCGPGEDPQGLWRTSRPLGGVRGGLEVSGELLLPGCVDLAIRYAYTAVEGSGTLEWRDEWLFPDEFPQAVEVTVRFESGREIRRVMAIPIGVLKSVQQAEGAG